MARELFAGLTDGGFRSWLFQLHRQSLIYTERTPEHPCIILTQQGERAVRDSFPALNPRWEDWAGEWQLLLFLQAPAGDAQFRYLRQLLLKEGGIPLARGAYLFPQSVSQRILVECEQRYSQSVALCFVKDWVFGAQEPVIIDYYDLNSKALLYSSISTELDRLLAENEGEKRLIKKHKMQIYSELDRLFELALEDPGFTSHYFPEVTRVGQLLGKVHQLLHL